jgi:hypothetical protein
MFRPQKHPTLAQTYMYNLYSDRKCDSLYRACLFVLESFSSRP